MVRPFGKQLATDLLELATPFGHLGPKYYAAPDSLRRKSHRAILSQTLYQVPLANHIIDWLPLIIHPNDSGGERLN